ncbi:MAG TPA: glutamine amidotransferase [Thermoclostridium sp.]|nr:glutamine amidotransferase [Thermoclostridium sp.]
MYEINICHLYPDLLNLYGDYGNIQALVRRLEWRGIDVVVHPVSLGDPFALDTYDIVFVGGGQTYEQEILHQDLLELKKESLIEAIENDTVFLCICGGYQLMGKYYKLVDGTELECLGAMNHWTIDSGKRMTGDLIFKIDGLNQQPDSLVVGFENHSGKTYLGDGVLPLGSVVYGNGNNGEDGYEGARYRNVFCSYSHGSLLPKNPGLTDEIITLAIKRKYKDFVSLQPLNNHIEAAARESLIKRFVMK